MTHLVYPGAQHTRFHHALGATHLMQQALKVLIEKGISLTKEEEQAACAAILLHDIGHGPFSHALEYKLSAQHHEKWSLTLMQALNKEFNGALDMAIEIFTNRYPKKFLHQLLSSQLDMDRMDYLNRDSFFTGVTEGKISHDRLVKMLHVVNDQLVVEQKGIYSVEKFVIARSLMYWQVYLHKTVLAAEQMLVHLILLLRDYAWEKTMEGLSPSLLYFLRTPFEEQCTEEALLHFISLDDCDIHHTMKMLQHFPAPEVRTIAQGLHNRKLFRCTLAKTPPAEEEIELLIQLVSHQLQVSEDTAQKMIWKGMVSISTYSGKESEILILMKNGDTLPLSEVSDHDIKAKNNSKYYLCHPKVSYG
jgi:HD superfamily phosphohydrolase